MEVESPPATAQAHSQPESKVGPARRSRAARRKAHARPVGRARSAGVLPFLLGPEVRAGGLDAQVVPVVSFGLEKAFADSRVLDAELLLLAGRRWQSVLPQWSTGPFSRPPALARASRPRFARMLSTFEQDSGLREPGSQKTV